MRKCNEWKYSEANRLKKEGVSRKEISLILSVNERTVTIWTRNTPRKVKSKEELLEVRNKWYKKNAITERKRIRQSNQKRYNRLKEWVNNYKSSKGCYLCGEKESVCLDFHHRDMEEKKYNISAHLHNIKWEIIEKEISKCEVVCANCHRKIHFNFK